MRAEAETQVRTLSEDSSIINEKITHKDSKVSEDRATIILTSKKLGVLEQKKIDQQRKQENLIDKKEEMIKNYEQMKQQHERI